MNTKIRFNNGTSGYIGDVIALELALREFNFEVTLVEVINLRILQIAGCDLSADTSSIHPYHKLASELNLSCVAFWRESEVFTPRQRAALEWTEQLVCCGYANGSDHSYTNLSRHFDAREIVDLSVIIATISAWSYQGVAFRRVPKID